MIVVVLSVIVLVALLSIPGLVVGIASGARPGWSIAAAPAVTFAIAGLAGWAFGAANIRFTVASTTLAWLVIVALAVAWRYSLRARFITSSQPAKSVGPAKSAQPWIVATPAALGVVIAAVVMITVAMHRLGETRFGIQSIPLSWDVHWHASVIKSIVEDGMASSTRMGDIQNVETHAATYYPAAWHAVGALFTQLSSNTVVAATNYMGLVIPALVTPISAAAIAWRIIDKPGWTASIAAALAALSTISLPVLVPIGSYVGAWPYQVGIALVGVTFAVLTSISAQPRRMLIAALALIGIGQLHPSAVPTTVVLTFVWWITYKVWAPTVPTVQARLASNSRRALRLREVALIAIVGIIAAALLIPQWLSGGGQADDIRAFSAQTEVSRAQSWTEAITMMTRHAHDFGIVWPVIAVAVASFVGLAAFYKRPWPIAAWALMVLFTAHGLNNFDGAVGRFLNLYTELHYSTPHRLIQTVAFVLCAGFGAGLAVAIMWFARLIAGHDQVYVALGLLTLAATVITPYAMMRTDSVAHWAYKTPRDQNFLITKTDRRAFDWLAKQPEVKGTRVFTHPSEGSAWMYPYAGVETVFHHYDWPIANKKTDTSMLYWHMNLLGVGTEDDPHGVNDVDLAAEHLNVSFIYASPPNYWPYQKRHVKMTDGLWWTPGVTPVYRDREVTIYAINRRVPEDVIERMRAESPTHLAASATRTDTGERIR